MLELRNVSTHYGKIQALHDVSVEVKEGEIVTLIGANGAGKTTLLMTLCGEPKPSSGSIWFEGEQISSLSTACWIRCSPCSPACTSDCSNGPAPCPAASSRCWP